MSNGDVEPYYIPRHLDDPERWYFWTLDEALVLVGPIILGYVFHMFVFGIALSAGGYFAYRKFKGSEQANVAVYGVYWYYPPLGLKGTPPSYVRRYVG